MQNIDLVIFDCDGVLIDSEVISAETLIALLAKLGVQIDIGYVQRNFTGRSFQKVATEIGQRFDIKLPQGFEAQYRTDLLLRFETQLQATKGIAYALESLGVKSCVATSSSPERVARSLEITQLAPYFANNIFTASQVNYGKPAPDLFLLAAKTMGVEPQNCLVIEDSLPGIEAAKRAKMLVWQYTGGSHLAHMDANANSHMKADRVFADWPQIFELVPRLCQKMV